METINELARETPIIHRTEVLVVGRGPGGLAAAIASPKSIEFNESLMDDALMEISVLSSIKVPPLKSIP